MLSAFIVCGQVLPSGVALPALQGEQFLTIEAGAHTADISRVVFTPDGKTMLSGGYDKVVRVWDSSRLAQGIIAQERVLRGRIDRGKEGQIYSLAVNGEGLVAIGGVQREIGSGGPSGPLPDIGGSTTVFLIRLIDYRTGAVRKVIPVKDSATISALAFSPLPGEQNILYSADNNTSSVNGRQSIVRRWNIQESRFTEVGRHRAPIYGLAVSPDGKSLAVGDEMGGLKLWKATGGLISEVSVKSAVKSVAFSRDGKYVAAGCGNGEVLVFDAANVKTGQQVDTFKGKGDIWGLDFAKDPTTLAVGSELRGSDAALSEILVFKIGGGAEPVKSLPLSNPWIYALAIAPTSDTVVVGGDGGFMHSWPLDDKAGRTIDGWGQHINRVRWSQDGTTVGFGRFDPINGAFSIAQASLVNPAGATWSQSGRQPAGTKLEPNSAGTGYQITLAGRTLNLGLDQSAFGDRLTCVVPLPDGRYAIGSIYNLYIYDKDLRNKTALLGHQGGINDLALSPDGQWLASCSSDQTVRIWNLRSPVKQIGLRERGIEPTLSLFPAKEEQWVAWTPEGFFASSTGAERFIRMHRNPRTAREPAEAPDILRQYRDEYKRADVIAGLLKHGTVTAAHKAAQEDLRRQIIAQREREKAAIEARRRQQDEEQRKIAAEIAAKRAEEERLAREQKAAEAARARAEREQKEREQKALEEERRKLEENRTKVDQKIEQAKSKPVEVAPPKPIEQKVNEEPPPNVDLVSPSLNELDNKTFTAGQGHVDKEGVLKLTVSFPNVTNLTNVRAGTILRPLSKNLVSRVKRQNQFELTVQLVDGANEIELYAERDEGNGRVIRGESLVFTVQYRAPVQVKARKLYFLGVGVSQFKENWDGLQELRYAHLDAEAMAKFYKSLEGPDRLFSEVHTLVLANQQATKDGILEALKGLHQAGPEDVVMIHVSGHGDVLAQEGAAFVPYFLPHDFSPARIEETMLPWADFLQAIKDSRAARKLLYVDACRSGSIGKVAEQVNGVIDKSDLLAFVSCDGNELSYEPENGQLGYFTSALIESLNDKTLADNEGNISLFRVRTAVKRKVLNRVEEELDGRSQTPILIGARAGDSLDQQLRAFIVSLVRGR